MIDQAFLAWRRAIARPASAMPTSARAPGSGTVTSGAGGEEIVYEAEIAPVGPPVWVAEKVRLIGAGVKAPKTPNGVKLPRA